jgi:hypothetical protein
LWKRKALEQEARAMRVESLLKERESGLEVGQRIAEGLVVSDRGDLMIGVDDLPSGTFEDFEQKSMCRTSGGTRNENTVSPLLMAISPCLKTLIPMIKSKSGLPINSATSIFLKIRVSDSKRSRLYVGTIKSPPAVDISAVR